jgi:serine/threonine protein kinase
VHRDIKMSNIYVIDDVAKIGDFGIASTSEYADEEMGDDSIVRYFHVILLLLMYQ